MSSVGALLVIALVASSTTTFTPSVIDDKVCFVPEQAGILLGIAEAQPKLHLLADEQGKMIELQLGLVSGLQEAEKSAAALADEQKSRADDLDVKLHEAIEDRDSLKRSPTLWAGVGIAVGVLLSIGIFSIAVSAVHSAQ